MDLDVLEAEVHCLLGANGAGKSTLIKCVSGASSRPAVRSFQGEPLPSGDPAGTLKRGIATIYQELDLVPDLSVAESIFLAHEPRRWPLLDLDKMYRIGRSSLGWATTRSPCVRRWVNCGRQPSRSCRSPGRCRETSGC